MILKKAFSLVELSIVLIIIGTIAAAGLSTYTSKGDIYKIKQTKNKLDIIEKAISSYVKTSYRLPCPATVTLTPSSTSYGVEQCSTATSNAASSVPSSFSCLTTGSTNITGGMIPFKTLNLPKEFGVDGWGNKIMYNVTKALSSDSSYGTIQYQDSIALCNMGLLTVYGPGSSARATGAAYVILSYGPNGYYGYPQFGSTAKIASVNTDEIVNGSIASSNYLQAEQTSIFDDIVRYKMRWQLIKESGAVTDNISCIYNKTMIETYDYFPTGVTLDPNNYYCTNQPRSPDCESVINVFNNILNQKCLLK